MVRVERAQRRRETRVSCEHDCQYPFCLKLNPNLSSLTCIFLAFYKISATSIFLPYFWIFPRSLSLTPPNERHNALCPVSHTRSPFSFFWFLFSPSKNQALFLLLYNSLTLSISKLSPKGFFLSKGTWEIPLHCWWRGFGFSLPKLKTWIIPFSYFLLLCCTGNRWIRRLQNK